ncbi:peptidase dimerization domain-containing protein [Actinopolymorpha singaporensis]|uniref:peptidase dimerization domain-containing protein n=1 Tax=Actinopolymorpha singaporensis TaxID=117157 RepID=UPI000B8699EF|nr:peptidase dimerization domain-containing protein [Actinopolymorpha singaporensis]
MTPTVLAAGTTNNTVPAEASVHVDVRASSTADRDREYVEVAQLQRRAALLARLVELVREQPR